MRIVTIPMVVYPFDIIFLFNATDEQAKKDLEGYWTDDLIMKGTGKFILNKWGNLGIVRVDSPHFGKPDAICMGTLSHEIFHAVTEIFDYCGLPLNLTSQEAYAHMIGYITREVLNKIGSSVIDTTVKKKK